MVFIHSNKYRSIVALASILGLLIAAGSAVIYNQITLPAQAGTPGFISTVAGTGLASFNGDGIPATTAKLRFPVGVASDSAGNTFIADQGNNRIRRVDAVTGIITTVAGTGIGSYNGDGILATSASLQRPSSVAVDNAGNLFITDFFNHRIRRVDAVTGIITTVAGTGVAAFNGDGIPATTAFIRFPFGITVDSGGQVYFSDRGNQRVRTIDSAGLIQTVAGTGVFGFNGDGIPATTARLKNPVGLAFDSTGNLHIADSNNFRIRRVDVATQIISTVAGSGGFPGVFLGDNILATAATMFALDVDFDSLGNLYFADFQFNRVRRVNLTSNIITTPAGIGGTGFGSGGYNGDGILATTAKLNSPISVALDGSDNIYIADQRNHRIRRVDPISADSDGDGVLDAVDECVNTVGQAAFDGCPSGLRVSVQIVDTQAKSKVDQALETRIFDASAGSCADTIGTHTPLNYGNIFNTCASENTLTTQETNDLLKRVTELVTFGVTTGAKFVLVESPVGSDGSVAYQSFNVSPTSGQQLDLGFEVTPASSDNFVQVSHFIKDSKGRYHASRKQTVKGSILEVFSPDYTLWVGGQELYPFAFTSDSEWSVDVCLEVPAGYEIIGSVECSQAFVAGEMKVIEFTIVEVGSPPPNVKVKIKATKDGKTRNIKKDIPGRRVKHKPKKQN